jgi:hypothetical protein
MGVWKEAPETPVDSGEASILHIHVSSIEKYVSVSEVVIGG